MNNETLERVNEMTDLGGVIQSNLAWDKHIDTIVCRAKRVMGLIKRTVGHNAPLNVKLRLYTALVRSKLETCSQVWHGLCKKDKLKIEGIQRAASRYILSYPDMSYTDRLLKTKLLPLTYRRDMADVCMFFKCKKKYVYCRFLELF
jgi:hypothetical protein